jgi:tRNA G10  N-methylase Trm11
MINSLLILGRQPDIAIAELESLYNAHSLRYIGKSAAILTIDPIHIAFSRLGGSIKLCKVLAEIDSHEWPTIQKNLERIIATLIEKMPKSKISLGISAYDLNVRPQQLTVTGLVIKKLFREQNRSLRIVPNQNSALNSAQVIHNQLTETSGCEIICVRVDNKTIVAQTINEQDIKSYTTRDRNRPKRDARVGMLPPKLAQIIINLALGNSSGHKITILDPFCGTGVILQEGIRLGYPVYGTDISERMVSFSFENLVWFTKLSDQSTSNFQVDVADATTFTWKQPIGCVASELYLGQPFNSVPPNNKLEQVRKTCNTISENFLINLGKQIKSGVRICIALPAWQIAPDEFVHLPLIDHLSDLGYNRVRFEHVRNDCLLYYREDQVVARELLVITRN